MSLSWINFVTSGNIGFASVRDGPLELTYRGGGGKGGRSTKKIFAEGKTKEKYLSTSLHQPVFEVSLRDSSHILLLD